MRSNAGAANSECAPPDRRTPYNGGFRLPRFAALATTYFSAATFKFLRDLPTAGHQEWDVFLTVGTLQFGGGVDVDLTRERHLIWRSLRGTRHTFDLSVEPVNEPTLLTMEMSITIRGLAMAWMAERISRSIIQRHIEAGVHELRHHLEWELD